MTRTKQITANDLRAALYDFRLDVHAYPPGNMGAAVQRLMAVGFKVTHGYNDGGLRMARPHANGNETFCFVRPDGTVSPFLTFTQLRIDRWAREESALRTGDVVEW